MEGRVEVGGSSKVKSCRQKVLLATVFASKVYIWVLFSCLCMIQSEKLQLIILHDQLHPDGRWMSICEREFMCLCTHAYVQEI